MAETISKQHITDSRELARLAEPPRRKAGVRRHFSTTYLHRSLPEVFAFFSDARNLEAITPPEFELRTLGEGELSMRDGASVTYAFKVGRFTLKSRARILRWDPPFGFVDEQESGPFSIWHHIHSFTDEGDRVRMDDEVLYRLPFWPFGECAAPWARKEIERVFKYRSEKIRKILG